MLSAISRRGTCGHRNKSCGHLPAGKQETEAGWHEAAGENQEGDQNYDKLYIYR